MTSSGDIPRLEEGGATLSPLKRAFIALTEAETKLAAMEQAAREPIAVIGLGCRSPGGGNDAKSFWRLVNDGIDAIGPIPPSRWEADALYDPDPDKPGRIATRNGGFLNSIDTFDPAFFSIAPREAQGMDPQQRLLLEVCWEALEHAGQAPDCLEGTRTGVYMGVCNSDYTYLQLRANDPTLLDAHFTSGIAHSIVSGRLSYLLGLQGPSLTIDTACSSSLVAIHLACQSLRAGETRMALAGGVNLILSPDMFIALSRARMLAPDGRCKTFDAAADGFARGEGCGVVVLKRLRDARADGDRILAQIRGSAVNQDGASSSLTAPNGPSQEAVVREALGNAGLSPCDVGYIEAHGTATQLGDPLEVRALGAVFGPTRASDKPLTIGSVKTNIGHLEAAAGVMGLIKVVLALQHRTIPANLHFTNPSPHIAWDELPIQVPTRSMAWKPINDRRIAGVSSFGFSGTNAHIILEEAPKADEFVSKAAERPFVLALSAKEPAALTALATRFSGIFKERLDHGIADICHTADAGRAHFAHRATVVARTSSDFAAGLDALANYRETAGVGVSHVARRDPPRIAFLFTGQGSQYVGMARALYQDSAKFRATLDRCAELLAPHLERPLLDLLFATDGDLSRIDQTIYAQPALFAVEYALTELWRSWGITPNIVAGHSVGEYVAACVAGVLSLEDALALIAKRGELMQSLPSGGTMAAVFASESRVIDALVPYAGRLSIAAVNGPAQTAISGHRADVEAVCRRLTAEGIRCQALPVSHAFHSPLVEPVLDEFERKAATVKFSAPRLRLVSNLTGQLVTADEIAQPSYWRRHMREAVRFGDCLQTLAASHVDCCIEIGPHPTLMSFAETIFGDKTCAFAPSLRKGRADLQQMLESLAAVYRCGATIDWRGVADGEARQIVDLPRYPFQRQRYWFEAKPQAQAANGGPASHSLLGTRVRSASSDAIYETQLGADMPSFVRHHRVSGRIALPATAYLDMLLTAGAEQLRSNAVCLEDVVISEAMLLNEDGKERIVQTICGPARNGLATLSISSMSQGIADPNKWTRHVTANVRASIAGSADGPTLKELQECCTQSVSSADHYADLTRRGIEFGSDFHVIGQMWRGKGQALGEIVLGSQAAADTAAYRMHPLLLDGCLQVMASALAAESDGDAIYLPIGIGRYSLDQSPGSRCWSHVTIESSGGETCRADVRLFDSSGRAIGELRDVQLKRVTRDALERLGERWLDDSLYQIEWRSVPPTDMRSPDEWIPSILAGVASEHADALRDFAGIDKYDVFHGQLESLCVDYVLQAMRQLEWTPALGETITAATLAGRLGVLPRHLRLFGRLLSILGEAGWLEPVDDGWRVKRAFDQPHPDKAPGNVLAHIRKDCPRGALAELELTGRVASRLAQVLRGECDPMQLLFPEGSTETAEALYRDAPTAQFFNGLTAEILAEAVGARSVGRPLRILEIGAGTGGTTARVVPRLPVQGVTYTFTDIGPTFVARARERFAAYPMMQFEVLNLEHDPEDQGFDDRRFDIVIASNVIHATADLRHTLARVRRLLAPGGLLAMLEVTAPQRWFDLTVGLTEGWWAFADTDLRPDYATLSRERWMRLLPECGFDAVAAMPEGRPQGSLALQSLFLARANARIMRRTPRHWLLLSNPSGMSARLAARLRTQGDLCTLAVPHDAIADATARLVDPHSAADFRRLLDELRAAGPAVSGVIHAWSPDAGKLDRGLPDVAAAAQSGAVDAMVLAQALVGVTPPPRVWFVTQGAQPADACDRAFSPAQAALWGLGKAVSLEHPELQLICVDLDQGDDAVGLDMLAAELDQPGTEAQIAFRQGDRRVARLARLRRERETDADESATPWRLVPTVPGVLDQFDRAPIAQRPPGPGEVQIAVEATGLNFKDVLNVLGMYPGNPGPLGGECAGKVLAVGPGVTHVRPGDEVMAVASGSFASHVMARAELVQPYPAGMSAVEAAAFPIAFLTAEFCLGHLARLRAGERVLIHAASGGVGMAAVRLAQRAGAKIFATAGSPSKRELLHAMGVVHVFDSRSDGFADAVLAATDGHGVDVVLNSLSGKMVEASFRALARGGRFVEIGKRDIKPSDWVAALHRDIQYFVVDWGETAAQQPELIGAMFARLTDDLRSGAIMSLPRHIFSLEDAPRAFRLMAEAAHVGKVVVAREDRKATLIRKDGTYLVTGGLSGLGLLVARWLAEQGAGRLVLIGRRAVTPDLSETLKTFEKSGTIVVAESVDVTDAKALHGLLQKLRKDGPPLRGIVHSAGLLYDASLMQQTAEKFGHVFGPKVVGGALLDSLTRSDPLDWFVLFSSIAAVLGSRGQANHSAANAFLDALAHQRRMQGRPAQSINWGGWTEIGAADRAVTERLAHQGFGLLSPDQGITALERLMHHNSAQSVVLPMMDWHRYAAHSHPSSSPSLLVEVIGEAPRAVAQHELAKPRVSDLAELLADAPNARRRSIIATFVRERALQTLGLDSARPVDPRMPLGDLGLDSLLSVELRNRLSSAIGKPLPATLLFDHPTIDALTNHLAESVLDNGGRATEPSESEPEDRSATVLVDTIEDLSDEEVDRLFAARVQAKGAL